MRKGRNLPGTSVASHAGTDAAGLLLGSYRTVPTPAVDDQLANAKINYGLTLRS